MGETPGSRRLKEEHNTADAPGQTVPPPRVGPVQPLADPRPAGEGDDDAAADERTSPFPYAESFDEWVADETAAPDDHWEGEHVIHRRDPLIEGRNSYGTDPRHRPD